MIRIHWDTFCSALEGHDLVPTDVCVGVQNGVDEVLPLVHDTAVGLPRRHADRIVEDVQVTANDIIGVIMKAQPQTRTYGMILLGSRPQSAAITTLGSACSILVHSSLAANPETQISARTRSGAIDSNSPPKTTE